MKHRNTRGVALIMVLALLVLLSAIVIAFLSSVTTDVAASKSYEGQTSAREVADSAVNLVISQIRQASTQSGEAWISQPGLVRTFDSTGQTGAYKLFSASQLYVPGRGYDPADTSNGDLPTTSNWNDTEQGLWTDINAPVVYKDKDNNQHKIYPILDQTGIRGDGTIEDVDGFEVQQYAQRETAGLMPVRWLYMLQDGTLLPASSAGGDTVKVSGSVTDTNPIIARIAFWTDDETCKLNINTASEGVFWDTPIANSQAPPGFPTSVKNMFEMDLANYMPASREYQRFPGHPAQTSLYPVFGQSLMKKLGINPTAASIPAASWANYVEAMYQITPRVTGKDPTGEDITSKGGTKRAGKGALSGGQEMNYNSPVYAVNNDTDRLYATVDELFFDPKRAKQQLATSDIRGLVERSKFFLTATSKAPEQNAFNRPRVSIWPITIGPNASDASDTSKMTPFDKLFAFCSTVGSKASGKQTPFFFMRKNPNSMTDDWSGIGSNVDVFNYLLAMCGKAIPSAKGGEGRFNGKYSAGAIDQILLEMYDYVRCTNLVDTSDDATNASPTNTKSYTTPDSLTTQVGPPRGWQSGAANRGQVLPISNGTYRGFGRVSTLSEIALVVAYDNRAVSGYNPATQAKIQIALVPNFYCPMAGYSALANNLRLTFEKIDVVVKVGGQIIPWQQPFNSVCDYAFVNGKFSGRYSSAQSDESKLGGDIGPKTFLETVNNVVPINVGAPAESNCPVGELVINKPAANANDLTIEGGTVIAYISYPGNINPLTQSGGTILQKFVFNFPAVAGGMPYPTPTAGFVSSSNPTKSNPRYGSRGTFPIRDEDVVRSLVATGGGVNFDMRIIACKSVITADVFQPHLYYNIPSTKQAMSIMGSLPDRGTINGAKEGSLTAIPVTATSGTLRPYVGTAIGGVNQAGVKNPDNPIEIGDWDNGPHFLMDGSYLNKADEGTAGHTHAGGALASDRAPYLGANYVGEDAGAEQATFFSPNRQIASPVAFGSLPTRVLTSKGWQTLLFRPAIAGMMGGKTHPGANDPPDHRLLDLFWMPVVEPYAISEPFATAGKVNMNYQIAPFTYIKRTTAMLGVLRAVKVTAINPNQVVSINSSPNYYSDNYKKMGTYSLGDTYSGGVGIVLRRDIDGPSTLKFFEDDHFKSGTNEPFITESEICAIPLVPLDITALGGHVKSNIQPPKLGSPGSGESTDSMRSKLATFWKANTMTGDNSLERPYALIYPRLTTKSNSYTVHVKVQMLKKVPVSIAPRDEIKEGRDQVTGEFRGSFVIERYLDPTTQTFNIKSPDDTLGPYKFRVVSSKQFVQ